MCVKKKPHFKWTQTFSNMGMSWDETQDIHFFYFFFLIQKQTWVDSYFLRKKNLCGKTFLSHSSWPEGSMLHLQLLIWTDWDEVVWDFPPPPPSVRFCFLKTTLFPSCHEVTNGNLTDQSRRVSERWVRRRLECMKMALFAHVKKKKMNKDNSSSDSAATPCHSSWGQSDEDRDAI